MATNAACAGPVIAEHKQCTTRSGISNRYENDYAQVSSLPGPS